MAAAARPRPSVTGRPKSASASRRRHMPARRARATPPKAGGRSRNSEPRSGAGKERAAHLRAARFLLRTCHELAGRTIRLRRCLVRRSERPAVTDFSATRTRFHLPEGVVYLDGNSLGPLPRSAAERARQVIEAEWGEMLIRGWNQAGWMEQPRRVGDRIARLIGAAPGCVVMGDTLSVKMYQALAS